MPVRHSASSPALSLGGCRPWRWRRTGQTSSKDQGSLQELAKTHKKASPDRSVPDSYDWTADSRYAWTVPVGLDVGKVFKLGERSISLQLGAYTLVERPTGAPDWIVRARIQFSFLAGK